jgi:hypothetical protein
MGDDARSDLASGRGRHRNALLALGGGVGTGVADGLSMPRSVLADTPFSTLAIPGLILALVVGGPQEEAPTRRDVVWGGRGLNPGPRDYESPALTG